jgi:hypothetical protein
MPSVPALPTLVVPLRSRRRERAIAMQKLPHTIGAIALLFGGLRTLGRAPAGFDLVLAIVEVTTSALLIGSVAYSLRRLAKGHAAAHTPHNIDWVDIFVAGVLGAEALERWHAEHHIARPVILLAIFMLVFGFAHGRFFAYMERKRSMRIGPDGIVIPRRPFGRLSASWREVAGVTITPREAVVTLRNGRTRRIDLADVQNADQVVAALREARARAVAAAPKPPPVPSPSQESVRP